MVSRIARLFKLTKYPTTDQEILFEGNLVHILLKRQPIATGSLRGKTFYLDVYNKPMMHIPPNQHLFVCTGHTALLSGTTDTQPMERTPNYTKKKNQAYRYTRKIYQLPRRIQHDQIDIRSNSQHARRRIDKTPPKRSPPTSLGTIRISYTCHAEEEQ